MKLLTIGLSLFLSVSAWAQNFDAQKIDALSKAIAHAEGFYKRGTIPNLYHNPGDLKSRHGLPPLAGQRRIGKAGHIVFISDAAGWAALQEYILKIAEGRSRHYAQDTTLTQLSHVYAQRWRPWIEQVSKTLNIPPTTRLREFLAEPENSVDYWPEICYNL